MSAFRQITGSLNNQTDFVLKTLSFSASHGEYSEDPPVTITGPGGSSFVIRDTPGSVLTGAQGTWHILILTEGSTPPYHATEVPMIQLEFDNPPAGFNSRTQVIVNTSGSTQTFDIEPMGSVHGDHANMQWNLSVSGS